MGVFTCRSTRARGPRGWITPLLAACVMLAAPPLAADTPTHLTLMVSGTAKMIYLPATLAQRLGYFRDEGLDVELLSQPAGVDAESELLTGYAQGVVGFYDHTIDLQTKGKEVRAIVVFSHVPGEAEVVSTRLPATVQSLHDLRGRTLGVTGLGSSTSFLTRHLMAQQGLGPGEYTMLPVGAEHSFVSALRSGRIDAGMTTDPTATRLIRNKEARMLLDLRTIESTRAALGGPYPAACLYVQTEWLEATPNWQPSWHAPSSARCATCAATVRKTLPRICRRNSGATVRTSTCRPSSLRCPRSATMGACPRTARPRSCACYRPATRTPATSTSTCRGRTPTASSIRRNCPDQKRVRMPTPNSVWLLWPLVEPTMY